jgi:hypothetical protein
VTAIKAARSADMTDPRRSIGQLADDAPLVLFPVRIETRFADIGTAEAPQHQLWVRIFPDDCSIDTFEATLSDTEVANAKIYWQRMFAAGGVEGDERGAWRALVAAHGSGRAGYIVDTYQPVNVAQAPTKAQATDEILVIATQTALSAAEATAISGYWTAVWIADGNAAQQQAAATALENAVGSARAAALVSDYVPFNLADVATPPATKTTVASSVTFVVLPADPAPKSSSWSQAAQVTDFPERFVVIGYQGGLPVVEAIGAAVASPLYVGPDPSADPADSIHPSGEDLIVPDQLAWLVDFPRAQADGMALAIDLTPEQAHAGFDRLLVIGLKLGTSASDATSALEELLRHHATGRSGLALIAQGTPTHNTTGTGTGYTQVDDPDLSFDTRRDAPLFTPDTDPMAKRDGQWVAEALEIDPGVLTGVPGAGGQDQLQARAMQRALWPATLGYWLDKMLTPLVDDDTVASARWFFSTYVSGRGSVPALRIGRQPYGILPTTAFSRIGWLAPRGDRREVALLGAGAEQRFLAELLKLLREIDGDWTAMSAGAAYVGKSGDAHQMLLDIIGLQPASVDYYWRYSESIAELYNIINLWGLGPQFWQALVALGLHGAAEGLLARLGGGGIQPDILNHAFLTDAGLIGQVVDDRLLSETAPVRPYTGDGRNYIQWLIDAATTSLDAVAAEQGFIDDISPQALLYLFLRHAVMLGYYDSSYELHKSRGILSAVELAEMKPEPAFIHVDPAAPVSESRYAALYKTEARITGSPTQLVSDFITRNLTVPETAGLADQLAALAALASAPTAALERAFAEHIDTCSYRFDAWLLGIVNYQLQQMRARSSGNGGAQAGGSYLGAYAWVENLRPSTARLQAVTVPDDIASSFAGPTPIQHDPSNGGFFHAPSLPHARTAAVLRSGYLANASAENPDTLSVNLSSDRVRAALSVLEGVRNGQSIGALLGYQFERGLHDDHNLAEVDQFIYPLRKAFPLVADSLAATQTAPDVPIEAIEARNVMDGRKLVEKIRSNGATTYPFGVAGLPSATSDEATAINHEANSILDTYDAIADLALAEGVHQAVQGNFERVAATIDAYSNATFPPDPEVAQTPTVGIGLTHRVAIHFESGLPSPTGATPRSIAEPALDAWLESVLPGLDSIGATVVWTDPVSGAVRSHDVRLSDLSVRPRDLIELVKPDDVQAMAELDDRVLRFVLNAATPRADAALQIRYQTAPAGKLSIFEASALIRQLRQLVQRSRPLRATDATLTSQATGAQNTAVFADRSRLADPVTQLGTLRDDLTTFLSSLDPLLADLVTNRAAIIAGIDGFAASAIDLLERAAQFGLPQAGWGFAFERRRSMFADLMTSVQTLVTRWDGRLTDFAIQLTAYDALPAGTSDDARFALLQKAEALVTATIEPMPATPTTLRSDIDAMHTAMVNRRNLLAAIPTTNFVSFASAFAAVQALLPIDVFDAEPWDVNAIGDRAVAFAQDLQSALHGQHRVITDRLARAQAELTAHDAAATAATAVTSLQAGAKAVFGDSFVLIPEFTVQDDLGSQWANSLAAGGALLAHLTGSLGIERPVPEWLAGAARVRPVLRSYELTGVLAEAFGQAAPVLTPAQFPYLVDEPWMAMQFPEASRPDSDRLLYTAHYVTSFDPTARQCGLLLDEWTEVIPATSRETGLTFDFDRPDNEAAQAILIVTPATGDGVWHWDDVTGALNETLDLVKKRALEPVQLDATAYATFLPATIMAVTLHGISITTALASADGVLKEAVINRG